MSAGQRPFQLTLAILKPDLTSMPFGLEHVRQMILDQGFIVLRSQPLQMKRSEAEDFYQEHRGRFFYNRLVTYMSSGVSHVHILARPDAVAQWRLLAGPTKVMRARYENPETIRGMFGLSDTRNCVHGSDSDESAKKELGFFFPDFNVEEFLTRETESSNSYAEALKNNRLNLDRVRFVHFLSHEG